MVQKWLIKYDDLEIDDEEYNQRIKDITNYYVYQKYDIFFYGEQDYDWKYSHNEVQDVGGGGYNPSTYLNLLHDIGYTDLTKILLEVKDNVTEENKWVIINTYGHGVFGLDIAQFYESAVKKCEEADSPMMCHIMYHPNDSYRPYPYLHNQCIILDVLAWEKVGCPPFEWINDTNDTLNNLARSEENFHDDYTPYWVGPETTEEIVTCHHREFGSLVIQKFAEAGYRIINFDHELRKDKWHLYPNHKDNYKILKHYFETGEIDQNHHLYKSIINRVSWERDHLEDNIYILNTEEIAHCENVVSPIDHYIAVAGGFKTALLTHKYGFHDKTQISFTDISDGALDFQRSLRDTWDGDLDSYWKWTQAYQDSHPQYYYAWRSWLPWDEQIDEFLNEVGTTKAEFKKIWNQYLDLDCEFIKVNFLEDHTPLLNLVKRNSSFENYYMWVSNAYKMQWTVYKYGLYNTQNKLRNLINELSSLNKNITVEHETVHTVIPK